VVCGSRVETGSLVFVNKNGERQGAQMEGMGGEPRVGGFLSLSHSGGLRGPGK
jgi:hypothetical protein